MQNVTGSADSSSGHPGASAAGLRQAIQDALAEVFVGRRPTVTVDQLIDFFAHGIMAEGVAAVAIALGPERRDYFYRVAADAIPGITTDDLDEVEDLSGVELAQALTRISDRRVRRARGRLSNALRPYLRPPSVGRTDQRRTRRPGHRSPRSRRQRPARHACANRAGPDDPGEPGEPAPPARDGWGVA